MKTIEEVKRLLIANKETEKELDDIVINYEDYKTGYTDSIYQIIIDKSVYYVADDEVSSDTIDLVIDYIEEKGLEGLFVDVDQYLNDDKIIDKEGIEYFSDEYVIGGNHGKTLYHGGNFFSNKVI